MPARDVEGDDPGNRIGAMDVHFGYELGINPGALRRLQAMASINKPRFHHAPNGVDLIVETNRHSDAVPLNVLLEAWQAHLPTSWGRHRRQDAPYIRRASP